MRQNRTALFFALAFLLLIGVTHADAQKAVSIFFGGNGSGVVTTLNASGVVTTPGGSCSSDCTLDFVGTDAILTASAQGGSTFVGWGGSACMGAFPTCDVTLSSPGTAPVIAYFRSNSKTVSVGGYHTCVLRPAGDVMCWGRNREGQIGASSTNDTLPPSPAKGITNAVALATGGYHTCAIHATGGVLAGAITAKVSLASVSAHQY
jgi:Regulator of chromosome condensation (RCC1) repeat